jgi:hypothetical protein
VEDETQALGADMENLFWPQVKPEQWHPTFKGLWQQRNPWNECVLADWAAGFQDRDDKFVKEFQTTFNSSFWELYLFACLKQIGFVVDFNHHAPDFVASKGGDTVCIEAVIASHAEGTTPEWDREAKVKAEETERQTIIERAIPRLANAVASKVKLYRDKYSQLEHVKKRPFVIAVAPFEQPLAFLQTNQPMRNILYQYDIPITKPIPEENRRLIFGHEYVEFFTKPNGTKIELGFFLDERMKEVSAVIFSNLATWGKVRVMSADPNPNILFQSKRFNENGLKPHQKWERKRDYRESLLDGVHIFLNPHADTPLPSSMFNWPDVEYHDIDEDRMVIETAKDSNIYWRRTLTLSPDMPEAEVQKQLEATNEYIDEEQAKDLAKEAAED